MAKRGFCFVVHRYTEEKSLSSHEWPAVFSANIALPLDLSNNYQAMDIKKRKNSCQKAEAGPGSCAFAICHGRS